VASSSGSAGRRLTTVTVDQAISSASNILITLLAARVLGTDSFGLFGVVLLTYMTIQGVSRALIAEPLLVRPKEAEERPGEAVGAALVFGLGMSVLVAIGAVAVAAVDEELGLALLVLAATAPLLVLQDTGRYLAFAVHQPSRAVALDVAWLAVIVGAVAVIELLDVETLSWFIFAWAGSGAAAGLLVLHQWRGHRVQLGTVWLRETWPFSWRYAISFAARQGAVLVASSAIVVILDAAALGAIRGALLLYGPLVQLQAASVAAGVAEVARLARWGREVNRHIARSTVLTTGAAAVNLLIVLVLPDNLGELALGDTWEATKPLLLPAGLQMIFLGSISGVRSALLGARAVATTLRLDIITAVLAFVTPIIGALVFDDVEGAYWVLSAGTVVAAMTWWVICWDHVRHRTSFDVAVPARA
jgi:hypothetical protein